MVAARRFSATYRNLRHTVGVCIIRRPPPAQIAHTAAKLGTRDLSSSQRLPLVALHVMTGRARRIRKRKKRRVILAESARFSQVTKSPSSSAMDADTGPEQEPDNRPPVRGGINSSRLVRSYLFVLHWTFALQAPACPMKINIRLQPPYRLFVKLLNSNSDSCGWRRPTTARQSKSYCTQQAVSMIFLCRLRLIDDDEEESEIFHLSQWSVSLISPTNSSSR